MKNVQVKLLEGNPLSSPKKSYGRSKFIACVGPDNWPVNKKSPTKNTPSFLQSSDSFQSIRFPVLQKASLKDPLNFKNIVVESVNTSNVQLSARSHVPGQAQESPLMQIVSISPKMSVATIEAEVSQMLSRKPTQPKLQPIDLAHLSGNFPEMQSPNNNNTNEVFMNFSPAGEFQNGSVTYNPTSTQVFTIDTKRKQYINNNKPNKKSKIIHKRAPLRDLTSKSINPDKEDIDIQDSTTAMYTPSNDIVEDFLEENRALKAQSKKLKHYNIKSLSPISLTREDLEPSLRKDSIIRKTNEKGECSLTFSESFKINSLVSKQHIKEEHQKKSLTKKTGRKPEKYSMGSSESFKIDMLTFYPNEKAGPIISPRQRNINKNTNKESVVSKLGKIVTVAPFLENQEWLSPAKSKVSGRAFKK